MFLLDYHSHSLPLHWHLRLQSLSLFSLNFYNTSIRWSRLLWLTPVFSSFRPPGILHFFRVKDGISEIFLTWRRLVGPKTGSSSNSWRLEVLTFYYFDTRKFGDLTPLNNVVVICWVRPPIYESIGNLVIDHLTVPVYHPYTYIKIFYKFNKRFN